MAHSLKTYKTDSRYPEVSLESGSYKRSCSRREKWTCGLLCGAVILSTVLGIMLTCFIVTDGKLFMTSKEGNLLFGNSTNNSDYKSSNFQLGERMVNASEDKQVNMMKYLNDEVDPCENFYEFACGNYAKEVDVPESELFITPTSEAVSSIQKRLLNILESNSSSTGLFKALQVAQTYHRSCMKKEDDVKLLKDLLKDYGGWPVVKGENWKTTNYQKLLYKNTKYGISTNFLFDVFVDIDWKDPKSTKIYIDQPSFGMPSRLDLLEDLNGAKLQSYLNFQTRMAKLLGADDEEDAKKELKKSLLFEKALAEVSQDADERRNKSKLYNPMSLKHLQKITQNTSWQEYVQGVLDLKELSDEEEIIAMSPKYLANVDTILKKSKKRDIANYIIWRTILEATEYMSSPDVQKVYSKFLKSLSGFERMEARDSFCGKLLTKNFPLLSSRLTRQENYGDRNDSAATEEIVDYVKTALKKSINGVSWIRKNVTLEKAKKKLTSIKYFFSGVREEIFYPEFLDKYYEKLHLDASDSFFENQRKLVKLKRNKISKLQNGESEDFGVLTERKFDPFQTVYFPEKNKVGFPISLLEEHELGTTQSKFISFGKFGTSAGFGLSQALDDIGRQFTETGVLKLWWDKNSSMEYKEIMECIAKQYKHMLDDNENIMIPTRKTRDKNWSDLSGISVAYKAYQNWKKYNSAELDDKEQEYTTNQFFWISYAQRFCTNANNFTQYATTMMRESVCVPGKFRVNGPLQNLKEFSRDWKCPLKSKMNPTNKCLIW